MAWLRERKFPMSANQKNYHRLTQSERASIERELQKMKPRLRELARLLDRSPASISSEVKTYRIVIKGQGKGNPYPGKLPDFACDRLHKWPFTCDGCPHQRFKCSLSLRLSYSATRAQVLSLQTRSSSRKGLSYDPDKFELMMSVIRSDVSRGLSPTQIVLARSHEFSVAPATIYRWIARGYGGMTNIDLRRKVGYKKRRVHEEPKITNHGWSRSYKAFQMLPQEVQGSVCEMDCVCGRVRDDQAILTLYLRTCKMQLCLLLEEKTSSAVAATLDMLEQVLGKEVFKCLFGVILTDNGSEFAKPEILERSVFHGTSRTKVYYCDPRQSQQKGACEKNHVELRKIIPKGKGINFDDLVAQDMVYLMSQVNSEPRPSLMGLSAIGILKAAMPKEAELVMDALGIDEVSFENLNLTLKGLNIDRKKRGLDPLN